MMKLMSGRRLNAACLAGLLVLAAAVGGCAGVTSGQLKDFGLTEIARVVADLVGQFFGILLQSIAPGAVR
jgi:hypothetical protein